MRISNQGMNQSQYLDAAILNGETPGSESTDLNPGGFGVSFNTMDAIVMIPVAFGILFIPYEVSIPLQPTNNILNITVIILNPDGSVLLEKISKGTTNKVTDFPVIVLSGGSIIMITFWTKDNLPPRGVTLSVIGCFEMIKTTTVVTTGTTSEPISSRTSQRGSTTTKEYTTRSRQPTTTGTRSTERTSSTRYPTTGISTSGPQRSSSKTSAMSTTKQRQSTTGATITSTSSGRSTTASSKSSIVSQFVKWLNDDFLFAIYR